MSPVFRGRKEFVIYRWLKKISYICVCGVKNIVIFRFFVIKILYFKIYKESFFFIIRVLDFFIIKMLYFKVYEESFSFAMRVLDYFTIKALYLKVHKGSLSFAIKVLDLTNMVLNRLWGSSEGRWNPRIYEHIEARNDTSMKAARGMKNRLCRVSCQWGLRVLVGRKVKPTHI